MVVKSWIHRAAIAGAIVLPVLLSGCGLFSQQSSKSIDPPQVEVLDDVENPETGQAVQEGTETNLTVYLEDGNGYLAPVALPTTIGDTEKAVVRALEMMTENGPFARQIPEGFRAMIPQGTEIKSYHYDKERKVAIVDFSEPFSSYNLQDERKVVESITWTLTAMTGIEGVELWYEGAKLPEMPVDQFPLDHALTRSIGINLELADGVSYAQSTPVTLYFSAQTINDEQYYVPVTRLVASGDNRAETAMKELIAGPLNKKELISVITPDVEVKSIEQKDSVVTIDLLDEGYQAGVRMPSEMMEAIVLSLTENTGATAVQIMFNGETSVIDDSNKSYSEPVGRPHHVNAIKS